MDTKHPPKPIPEQPGRGKPRDGSRPPRPKHDCRGCTITQIAPYPAFPPGATELRLPVSIAADAELVLSAIPSDPACPCEWRDRFRIAGHRVMVGQPNLARAVLNAGPTPLIETLQPRLARLDTLFVRAGCTLTIKLRELDQTLRAGIGLANMHVMIEIALQVRCAPRGRWRNIRIAVED